jgi:hypothetical protein
MAWYVPKSLRAHTLIIGIASVSMLILAARLIQDAWNSARESVARGVQAAFRELQRMNCYQPRQTPRTMHVNGSSDQLIWVLLFAICRDTAP